MARSACLERGSSRHGQVGQECSQPTFISGGQWRPRAPLTPSRTPFWVGLHKPNPSLCLGWALNKLTQTQAAELCIPLRAKPLRSALLGYPPETGRKNS